MFKWIKKIFMTEQNIPVQNEVQQPIQQQPVVRKFEIEVYDIDEEHDGKPQYTRHHYEQPVIIEAMSPADLKSKLALYHQCGQLAKIVKEVTPPSVQQQIQQNTQNQTIVTTNVQQIQQNSQMSQENNIQNNSNILNSNILNSNSEINVKQKPRYFKIGDIEVKDDNGKIYQKQWMILSESESNNIRVINNKNNSVVNMTGKHFEMKKWVLIEHVNEDDELTELEGCLNNV